MIQYPKVEHKLPEVFEKIIQSDAKHQELKISSVPSFQEFKDNKELRSRLRIGAENFIVKQKGGKV